MIKALLKNTLIKNTLKISGLLLVALVVYTLIVTLIQHLSKRKVNLLFLQVITMLTKLNIYLKKLLQKVITDYHKHVYLDQT